MSSVSQHALAVVVEVNEGQTSVLLLCQHSGFIPGDLRGQSGVTAAHVDETWCSEQFRLQPHSEKTNNWLSAATTPAPSVTERRTETERHTAAGQRSGTPALCTGQELVLQRSEVSLLTNHLKQFGAKTTTAEERRDTAEMMQNIVFCSQLSKSVTHVFQHSLCVLSLLHTVHCKSCLLVFYFSPCLQSKLLSHTFSADSSPMLRWSQMISPELIKIRLHRNPDVTKQA